MRRRRRLEAMAAHGKSTENETTNEKGNAEMADRRRSKATPKEASTMNKGTRQMIRSSCARPRPVHAVATPGIHPKKTWKIELSAATTLAYAAAHV